MILHILSIHLIGYFTVRLWIICLLPELFIAGICGLVFNAIKKYDCICINFLAVIAVALLFYSQVGEHQYVFSVSVYAAHF